MPVNPWVSQEEAAQVGLFRYILAHSVKEGLVAQARDWPGVHSVREILAGEPIRGYWFDRTQEYAARNRGEEFGRLKYASEETFELTLLPCWAHLSAEDYRQRVAELVAEIESTAATELAQSGRVPLGIAGVLRQSHEDSSASGKEIYGAALSRGDESRTQGFLGRVRHVRGRLSGSLRAIEKRRPDGALSSGFISSRPSVRESRGGCRPAVI